MIITHKQKALHLFSNGYNCSQSVIGAFAEDINIPLNDLLALTSSLGGGIAGLRQTCGAELGAILVLGKVYFDLENPESKNEVAKISRQFIEEFQARNDGDDQCAQLLKRPTLKQEATNLPESKQFPNIRPCAKYVTDCIELLELFISNPS